MSTFRITMEVRIEVEEVSQSLAEARAIASVAVGISSCKQPVTLNGMDIICITEENPPENSNKMD